MKNHEVEDVNCGVVLRHICENLGEELNSDKCVAIKAHLESCPKCKSYFDSVETTIDMYRSYTVELSEDIHANLMKYLKLDDCK